MVCHCAGSSCAFSASASSSFAGTGKCLQNAPASPRFIHVDLGLTGDCAGIASTYVGGFKSVRRQRGDGTYFIDSCPTIGVDFMLRIRPPSEGEVDFSKIRSFIISIRDLGLPILKVTADGYQCFTGDTKVSLLDGTERMLCDLACDFGRDKEFGVYAYDHHCGRVVAGRARNARRTGRKEICQVYLDNGSMVRCTLDHGWMLKDGTYCQAKNLRSGDSLMPLYRRVSERGRDSLDGYEMILQPRKKGESAWQYTHRTVANPYRPRNNRKKVVHHKNFNKTDNSPENLEWLVEDTHITLHQKQGSENSPYAKDGYWTLDRRRKQAEMVRALHTNPEYHARAVNNLIPGQTSDLHREVVRRNAILRNKSKNHPRRLHFVTPARVLEVATEYPACNQREIGQLLGVSQDVIASRLDEAGIGRGRGWRERMPCVNHKVVRVEFAGEYEDVYDIEVDEHHNFALSSGVFVHNSRDFMQIMRKIGFESNVYSVDRTDEPYLYLRQAIIEKRIEMYKYKIVTTELSDLERDIDRRKVDHPKISSITGMKASKDVADALCGAVAQCMIDPRVATTMGQDMLSQDRATDGGYVVDSVTTQAGTVDWRDIDREVKGRK